VGLAVEVAVESRRPAGLSAAERSELALIGERLEQLRRREVAAARLQPSKLIEGTLGARPTDPAKAALWNEGVDLIYTHRHRHGIVSRSGDPLGPKSGEAARRAERRASRAAAGRHPAGPRPEAPANRRAVRLDHPLRHSARQPACSANDKRDNIGTTTAR
jgi:hypothetical protein